LTALLDAGGPLTTASANLVAAVDTIRGFATDHVNLYDNSVIRDEAPDWTRLFIRGRDR
jgi:hypothetical protein